MPGAFSISGLASGLDTAGIIDTIMKFGARPIDLLNGRIAEKQNLLTAYKTFEANLLALKIDLSLLNRKSTFEAKTTAVSDEDVFTATATSVVPPGTYTFKVDQLAQNHQMASQGFADADSTNIGTGTVTIALGGRSPSVITIDQNSNTLEGLAKAINDADAGVQATIVNSGNAQTPYRLLLTGEHTGVTERITFAHSLSGGTAPIMGSVGPVVPGIMQGTSSVTSSGVYTGDSSSTIAFNVTAIGGSGQLGADQITLSYTNGSDINGTLVLPSTYVPGQKTAIVNGLDLSFSAGTLKVGDAFSVDVVSATIQEPIDAQVTLGTGAAPLTLTSSTNTVSKAIDGLTLELLKVSSTAVTLTVGEDREGIKDAINGFVEQYNAFVGFISAVSSFDPETEVAGGLLGEETSRSLYRFLQRGMTGTVQGLTGTLDHLVELGIRMDGSGNLSVDNSTLDQLLQDDLPGVMKLFVADGQTTDANVQFLVAGSDTVPFDVTSPFPNGYDILISQAAEKALYAGTQIADPATTALVINTSNNALKIKVNGRESGEILIDAGSYTTGDSLAAEIEKKINLDDTLGNIDIVVRYVDDGGGNGHLEFQSKSYGATSSIEFKSPSANSIFGDIGVSTGQAVNGKDVKGSINGETATGVGQILAGDNDNKYTDGLQLLVTITATELTAQGNNLGTVKVTKGLASRVSDFINSSTADGSGKLFLKQRELNASVEGFEDQIERMQERLDKRRIRLERQFAAMEEAIQKLQGQGDFLAGALQNLSNTRR